MKSDIRTVVGVLIILMPAGWSTRTTAQVQSTQDGRALDASIQAGSNGYNTPVNQYDFSGRNNMMTGNVSNYQYFRDDVGYTAPGEIQDTLQSDDLFRFNADSLSSSPVIISDPGIPNLSHSGYSLDVYRSLPPARAGTFAPTRYSDTGGVTATTNAFQLGTYSLRNQSPFSILQSPVEGRLQNDYESYLGRSLEATYFPETPASGKYTLESWTERESNSPKWENDLNQYDNWWFNDMQQEDAVNRPGFSYGGQPMSPTLMLGRQLQTGIDSNQINTMTPTADFQIKQLEESFAELLTPDVTSREDDVYMEVLDAIKRMQQGEQPEEDAESPDDDTTARKQTPWEQSRNLVLAEPTLKAIEEAEKARDEAVEKTSGLPEVTKIDQMLKQALEGSVERNGRAIEGEPWEHRFDELISTLNYDLVPLDSLVSERESRVNTLMQEAQEQFDAGNYFSAEGLYRQSLNESPDRPMIRVGLIHSQLGVGMIRSAAFNLRQLYTDHPELIALRYAPNLLPPSDRLQWLQSELQDMIGNRENNTEAGLIMAYLGYQVSSRSLMRYGLAIAETDSPDDPLMPVLRRIWLGE